jgi:hypothetical protein
VNGQPASPPDVRSSAAKRAYSDYAEGTSRLNAQYRTALKKLDDTHAAEMEKLRQDLLAKLEDARKAATAADDLDEAIRIRELAKNFATAPKPPTLSPSENVRVASLQAEIQRLKGELGKKDSPRSTARLPKESISQQLAKALPGTVWQGIGSNVDGQTMGFQTGGVAFDWDRNPGKWIVNAAGTIVIEWADGNHWTVHASSDFTMATAVNDRGAGDRLKRIK